MLEELVDVYDKDKHLNGKIIRRKDINLLNEDEYIITVHCFIINSSSQILLTQRSLTKNRGGKWEETYGELKSGETSILGIQRELREEIGIDIKHNELKLVKTLKRKNTFRDIYIVKKDIPLDTIKYNDGEVINCKYVTLEQLKIMIKNNECTFEKLKTTSGAKFFIKSNQNDFPKRDFYLCTEVNKFNFILKVKNNLYIEKIDV